MRSAGLLAAALTAVVGCNDNFDPVTFIDERCAPEACKIRVLAIKAEPPEIPVGATTTLTSLVIDTAGRPLTTSWWTCLVPPTSGSGLATSDSCLLPPPQPFLTSVGSGDTVQVTMPNVSPKDLGLPDFTAGFYLPIRASYADSVKSVDAVYRLRLGLDLMPNHNPRFDGFFVVPTGPDGGVTGPLEPLEESQPPELQPGGQLTLRATFFDGSAELETIASGDPRNPTISMVPEALRVSWYATAGSFSEEVTSEERPDTVFTADKRLPPIDSLGPQGTLIDLYMVGRDERGGTDWAHRVIKLVPKS
jgi:hypothetical protein